MPYYLFFNPKTKEYKDVFFHMNDEKKYIDEKGAEWERQFTKPQAAVSTQFDFRNSKSFVEYSRNKKGSYGNLLDLAKEASIKREEKDGIDPIKENYYKEYSKTRKNKIEHPTARKEKLKEEFKSNKVIDVEL